MVIDSSLFFNKIYAFRAETELFDQLSKPVAAVSVSTSMVVMARLYKAWAAFSRHEINQPGPSPVYFETTSKLNNIFVT